jgi:serine/threonine-protein kinase
MIGDRYRIVSLLGEGGMGRVYAADHTMLERRVALKLLRKDAQAQPETVARFKQEALAASRIGHPNIVEVVDFAAMPDGQVYMVMEMLEGESLEEWMDRGGRLDLAIPLLIGLAEGLHAAHEAGVIHRDIKPANIFINSDGTVKILDFGIAKMTTGKVDGFETQAGYVLGTPYYLAPERVMGEPLTPQADLYSIGVIAYELLTGMVPFVADTFMAILARHVKTPAMDPRQAAPERSIPDGIARLTMRLLEKEPSARPASAAELARLLEDLLGQEEHEMRAVVTGPRELPSAVEDSTQLLDDAAGEISVRSTAISDVGPMASFADAQPSAAVAARGGPERSSTRVGHASSATEAPRKLEAPVVGAEPIPAPAQRSAAVRMWPVLAIALLGVVGGLAWTQIGSEDRVAAEPNEAGDSAVAPTASEPQGKDATEPAPGAPGGAADGLVGAKPAESAGSPGAAEGTDAASAGVAEVGSSPTEEPPQESKKPRSRGGSKGKASKGRATKSKASEGGAAAKTQAGGDAASTEREPKSDSSKPPVQKPADDGPTIKDDVYED